jgi:Protein of unknown function (DUF1822)
MLNSTRLDLTLPVPLTLKGHQTAELFYQQHSNPQKAKQVYLNTLAIDAVHSYLGWLGISTDLQASDSWNPFIQTLADVADLEIPGQGKLECRPVLPGDSVCHVPPEVWNDRIGYMAVQLDADLQTATLLGFAPSVDTEEIPLSQLQPIAVLLDQLKPQKQLEPTQQICLGQWTLGLFSSGWLTVEELFEPQPKLSFRSLELSHTESSELTTRGKLLDFAVRSDNHLISQQVISQQAILLIGILPQDLSQVDIWVKLCPANCALYLPEDLEIRVLDERGMAVMQAQSRQTEMLQLKFQGAMGERFSLDIRLNEFNLVESFVI